MDEESSGSKQFDGAAGPPSQHPEPEGTSIRLRGDELDLYSEFHRVLFRTVLRSVIASVDTVADACSFAWVQFEAVIEELKKLPPLLQRVVLVRSQIWKREEVAEVMGIHPDQVEPLLRAAAVQLAEVNEHRHDRERPVASPRAARLRELEGEPPEWLSKVIGRCPDRSKSAAGVILAWRRAALAIDDYRRATGYDHPYEAIGFAPRAPEERRAYVRAERAILRVADERDRRHGIER